MTHFFKAAITITFKPLPAAFVTSYLSKLKNVTCTGDKVVAICVDTDALSNDERDILFNDGMFTPQYYYYWTKLIFAINNICSSGAYNAYWINAASKKYYDETVSTCLDLMNDSIAWENNNPELYYAWGNISQREIFRTKLTCEGVVMPCLEGWGITAILNQKHYDDLRPFFEG